MATRARMLPAGALLLAAFLPAAEVDQAPAKATEKTPAQLWAEGQAARKAAEKTPAQLRAEGLAARKAAWEKLHAGLRLEPLRLNKTSFRIGEHLVASARLVNRSEEPLPIPATVNFFAGRSSDTPENLLGWERWWVKRKGANNEIKAYDREERPRLGGAYSNGQGVIQLWRTREGSRLTTPQDLQKGESLETDRFAVTHKGPERTSGWSDEARPATPEEIAGRVLPRSATWSAEGSHRKLRVLPGEGLALRQGNVLFTGPLPPGEYEITVQFTTLEETVVATETAGFTVQ